MRRALVLSGGGSKGAFEVGALDYLIREAGLDFRIFLGTSVGALNVSVLGQARNGRELKKKLETLKELWLGIKGNRTVYDVCFPGLLRLFFADALYKPHGLRRLLERHIDLDLLFDPATVVKISTVAFETGELFYADTRRPELKKDFIDYILASASMPLFFPGVPIGGKHWYDGGLRDITPLGAVFEEDPDEIVVIVTYPVTKDLTPVFRQAPPRRGALEILLRTVDILTGEIGANDLRLADLINRHFREIPGSRRIPLRIIGPGDTLPGRNALDFNHRFIAENMRRGYAAAQKPIVVEYEGTGRRRVSK